MAVKKLDIRPNPKKVKRLTIKPVRKVNGFDAEDLSREDYPNPKQLSQVANDEVIEIELAGVGLRMLIKPVSAIVAQISYEPNGNVFEEEIYAFLWKCEQQGGWRFWDTNFSNLVLNEWKKITKEL